MLGAILLTAGCRRPDEIKVWTKKLRNPAEREAAVVYFVKLRQHASTPEEKARVSSVVVPALCELYREYREPGVLQHIISFGDRRAVPTLATVLTSPNSSRSNAAQVARTLVDLKATEAVEPLVKVVQNLPTAGKPVHVAGLEAVKVLGKLGDRRAVPGLIKALSGSGSAPHIALCKAAATALGELGDARAVPALIGALLTTSAHRGDCYPQGRVALALLGTASIKALTSYLEEPDTLGALARKHGLSRPAATTRIVSLLGDIRAHEALPALLALAATHRGGAVEEAAIAALGRVASERAVEPLLKLLKDKSAPRRLRVQACRASVRLGAKRAIPVLLDLADSATRKGGDENLRYAAAAAYGLLVGAEVDAGYERIKEIWKKERERPGRTVFRRVLDQQDMAVRCLDDPLCYARVLADKNQIPVKRSKAVVMISTLPGGRKALPQLVRALHVRDTGLRRRFLWSAKRLGKSTDAALVKTLQAIIKRDASRQATFVGGDLESDGRVALAVILRKK